MKNAILSRREAIRALRRRPSSLTIPDRCYPHVRLVFEEMKRQRRTYQDVEDGAGVRRAAMKAWRHRNKPGLDSMEAVLGYLGWSFVPIPIAETLDPALVAALAPIAESFALTMPQTIEALVAIVTRIHERGSEAPATAPSLADLTAT